VFLLIRLALREDLERAFAFGMIKDVGGHHPPVGARAADEVIEAAATRLQSLDVKIYSA
jgi:hypothetical protein